MFDCPWPVCYWAKHSDNPNGPVVACGMEELKFKCPVIKAVLGFDQPRNGPVHPELAQQSDSKIRAVLNICPNVNVVVKLEHGNLCPQDCVQIDEAVHDGVYKGLNEFVDDLARVLSKDGAQ